MIVHLVTILGIYHRGACYNDALHDNTKMPIIGSRAHPARLLMQVQYAPLIRPGEEILVKHPLLTTGFGPNEAPFLEVRHALPWQTWPLAPY